MYYCASLVIFLTLLFKPYTLLGAVMLKIGEHTVAELVAIYFAYLIGVERR
jgi:hypothetical protein